MTTKSKTKPAAVKNVDAKSKTAPVAPTNANEDIDNDGDNDLTFDAHSFVSVDNLTQLESDLKPLWEHVMMDWQGEALSPTQRMRLLGAGVRRYGFLDKVSDLAVSNPEFIPPYLNATQLKLRIRETEMLRDIVAYLQQMLRIMEDLLLINGDEAYRLALMYYNTVRDASRRRVPGALPLYRMLEPFFKKGRRMSEEPTEHQIERDVRALLHGTKEGEIVVKNEGKKVTKGKKIVVDETHKAKGEWKETESGEIDE